MNTSEQKIIPLDQWTDIKRLARAQVDTAGWCTICETTIGNGSIFHDSDCPLYENPETDGEIDRCVKGQR